MCVMVVMSARGWCGLGHDRWDAPGSSVTDICSVRASHLPGAKPIRIVLELR